MAQAAEHTTTELKNGSTTSQAVHSTLTGRVIASHSIAAGWVDSFVVVVRSSPPSRRLAESHPLPLSQRCWASL